MGEGLKGVRRRTYVAPAAALALVAATTFFALHITSSSGKRRGVLRDAAASLKSSYEITVTRPQPRLATPVSRSLAVERATRETKFLGGDLDSAHLVYFTDPTNGKRVSAGAPLIRFSDHRLVWLVLFRHATEIVSGPPPGSAATTQVAVAAFVDAHSGAFINATTSRICPSPPGSGGGLAASTTRTGSSSRNRVSPDEQAGGRIRTSDLGSTNGRALTAELLRLMLTSNLLRFVFSRNRRTHGRRTRGSTSQPGRCRRTRSATSRRLEGSGHTRRRRDRSRLRHARIFVERGNVR